MFCPLGTLLLCSPLRVPPHWIRSSYLIHRTIKSAFMIRFSFSVWNYFIKFSRAVSLKESLDVNLHFEPQLSQQSIHALRHFLNDLLLNTCLMKIPKERTVSMQWELCPLGVHLLIFRWGFFSFSESYAVFFGCFAIVSLTLKLVIVLFEDWMLKRNK